MPELWSSVGIGADPAYGPNRGILLHPFAAQVLDMQAAWQALATVAACEGSVVRQELECAALMSSKSRMSGPI